MSTLTSTILVLLKVDLPTEQCTLTLGNQKVLALGQIISKHDIAFHCFADDIQLYRVLNPRMDKIITRFEGIQFLTEFPLAVDNKTDFFSETLQNWDSFA